MEDASFPFVYYGRGGLESRQTSLSVIASQGHCTHPEVGCLPMFSHPAAIPPLAGLTVKRSRCCCHRRRHRRRHQEKEQPHSLLCAVRLLVPPRRATTDSYGGLVSFLLEELDGQQRMLHGVGVPRVRNHQADFLIGPSPL